MTKDFKQSADESLNAARQPYQNNNQRRKKAVPTGPRLDPSGLFMRDTKPTPIQEILRHTTPPVIRTKRQTPEIDEGLLPSPQSFQQHEDCPSKRVRRERRSTTGNGPDIDGGWRKQSKSPNGYIPEAMDEAAEIPAGGDSFVREVEEHLKKKVMKRLKKQEKKRKRESAISDVPMIGDGQDTTQIAANRQQKKRKKVTQTLLDEREVGIDSETPIQSGQISPQAEKGRNKRLSPASGYVATSHPQVEGGSKSKRRKINEVR